METKTEAIAKGQNYIEQSGVKGMRWGVRKSRKERRAEAKQAAADHKLSRELAKKRVRDLSNSELQFLNNRLQLESKYAQMNPSKRKRREKKINDALNTYQIAKKFVVPVGKSLAATDTGQAAVFKGLQAMNSNYGRQLLSQLVVKTATSPMA